MVQESQSEETESKDELFAIEEQVGTVNHNHKGQFFVLLSFEHELDLRLSVGHRSYL